MHALLLKLSRQLAFLGGLVLVALILMTVVSVSGRLLNGALHGPLWQDLAPGLAATLLGLGVGPVNGDVELTEAGIAFAIFAFLPLCHIAGSHATVDVFTSRLPRRANQILNASIALIFAAVLILIAVQLGSGMLSKLRSGQTTFLIEFPVWWAYAACMPGAVGAAIVGIYLALQRMAELFGSGEDSP